MTLPAALRSFRHRNFRLFAAGQIVSLSGTWMQTVAQSWLVYRLTGSPALLGLVGFAGQIPVFLLAPAGGIVADRYSRRNIVIGTQAASMVLAFALAALTLSGRVQVPHIFALAALLGVVNAFDIPARQAFIVEMVEKDDLINAIALNSSLFNSARIVGPAVAGLLVAAIGEGWCFFANAVSYAPVIAGLALIRVPRRPAEGRGRPLLADIVEGFRFVAGNPPVHALMALLGVVSITAMPYAVLMPIFADAVLHAGARGLGLLLGASGAGALLAALLLASRRTVRGLGRLVALSAAMLGMSLIVFAASRLFWFSTAVLVMVGFAMMLEMGASNTLIQSMTPDRLRGRVMAVYSMMFMGLAPVGALLAGLAAARLGAPLTVALGGAGCTGAALLFAAHLPRLRPQARQLIMAEQAAAGDPAQEAACGGIPVDTEKS